MNKQTEEEIIKNSVRHTTHYKKKFNISLFIIIILLIVILTIVGFYNYPKERVVYKTFLDKELLQEQFIYGYINNGEISSCVVENSKKYKIDLLLLVALIQTESNFKQYATNYNRDSVDIGIMQLNTKVFDNKYSKKELYDISLNIEEGTKHLRWCLDKSNQNVIKALSMYNAGYGKVRGGETPECTLDYINKIILGRQLLEEQVIEFIRKFE